MATSNRLDRLTEREKECLRAWLDHKTAKEIALELGISHHAVEKRLKTARTKLDVTSSLEAARLLAKTEGYDHAVAQSPDLDFAPPGLNRWFTRPLILGVAILGILAAAAFVYAAQTGGAAIDNGQRLSGGEPPAPDNSDIPQIVLALGTSEQVEDYISLQFAEFDNDQSGFVEQAEGPRSVQLGCCDNNPRETLTGAAAWEYFLSENADDGDNRISLGEFRDARFDRLLRDGIPVKREELVVVGERASPYRENPEGTKPVPIMAADLEYRPASEDRVRAYVRTMFDNWDRDGSGYVELAEAPAVLGTPKARLTADGTAIYDRNDPLREIEGDDARAQYITNVDKDGDGKVSFEEYSVPVMPQYLERGIPLIPADWSQDGSAQRAES